MKGNFEIITKNGSKTKIFVNGESLTEKLGIYSIDYNVTVGEIPEIVMHIHCMEDVKISSKGKITFDAKPIREDIAREIYKSLKEHFEGKDK